MLGPRTDAPRTKVGTDESKSSLKNLGKAYSRLSDAALADLKAEAAKMNASREKLLTTPIASKAVQEAESSDLRPSQVQRLNQPRLDISLHMVTGHDVWSPGLGLGDHVCALKPSYVCQQTENFEAMSEFSKKTLRYDPGIEKNSEDMPNFSRSCLWANSGICSEDPFFNMVKNLVGQFDMVFSNYKLGGSPFIVQFKQGMSVPFDSSWIVIGAATAKPVSYTGVHLYVEQGLKLSIKTNNNIPHVGSVNQLFRDLLQKYSHSNNGSQHGFSLKVGGFNDKVFLNPNSEYGIRKLLGSLITAIGMIDDHDS